METLFSGTLACLHVFRHICIAVLTLILHLIALLVIMTIDF